MGRSSAKLSIVSGLLGTLVAGASSAGMPELPQRPALTGYTERASLPAQAGPALARISICSGQSKLYVPSEQSAYLNPADIAIGAGAILETGPSEDSRCRVTFATGDAIQLGPAGLIGIDQRDGASTVQLWQGKTIVYVMPALSGRAAPLNVNTAAGQFSSKAAKAGIASSDGDADLSVFAGGGTWTGKDGAQSLTAGQRGETDGGRVQIKVIAAAAEAELADQVSPELPNVKSALARFKAEDANGARAIFSRVQSAYPYNPAAAYYLGLMDLQQGRIAPAIEQWQRYVRIDPAGAKEKQVQRQLTVLITERIKDEVQQAVAHEKALGKAAPEPNSIAVHPLVNKGNRKDRKQQAVGKGLTAMTIADLAKVSGLKVLERQKIQKLLDEIKLSESGLVTKETALRSGRMLRAEKIVIGDYKIEPREAAPK
jgi:tetratricopeptide (TPR) repeat protein